MFSTGMVGAAGSLVHNTALLKKVYLPRLVIPLAATLGVVVDFAVAFVVLLCMMIGYQVVPSPTAFLIIPFTLLAFISALGTGVWLAALNVRYRDVKYVLPFLVQLWMFATPVAYSSSLITSPWAKTVYAVNPMVSVVDGFRWAMLGAPAPEPINVVTSTAVALVVLFVGVVYFRQTERSFADVV
jgi:lipopolysaccharide transport system permease protein